jgi:Na+/H+-dicarboxylate symporter
MKNLKVSLAWQILIAMVLGILLGSYLHYHSDSREWLVVNLLSPAGDIFIHLIKMIVVPIVISRWWLVLPGWVMQNSWAVLAPKPFSISK